MITRVYCLPRSSSDFFGSDRIGSEWFLKFGSDRIRTGSFRIGSDSNFKLYQLSDWELPIRSDPHTFIEGFLDFYVLIKQEQELHES